MRELTRIDDITAGYRHVFIEPHFDDIALSCGGTVAAARERGESCLVVTIFASNPPAGEAVTDFAAGQHRRWGGADDPIGVRRDEQRRALTMLGADWLPLGWFDAIYRGDQYLSDDDLFGPVMAGDAAVREQLRDELSHLRALAHGATWYVPLAVGNHVDHQIALEAAASLGSVEAYEDFPYAGRPGVVEARIADLGPLHSWHVPIAAELGTKIDAIACYPSQIPTLFGDAARMEQAVRAFAASRGAAGPAERYWSISERGRLAW